MRRNYITLKYCLEVHSSHLKLHNLCIEQDKLLLFVYDIQILSSCAHLFTLVLYCRNYESKIYFPFALAESNSHRYSRSMRHHYMTASSSSHTLIYHTDHPDMTAIQSILVRCHVTRKCLAPARWDVFKSYLWYMPNSFCSRLRLTASGRLLH